MPEIRINNFSGGMGSEQRDVSQSKFWYSENLNVGDNNYSLKQVVNNQAENTGFTQAFNILKMLEINGTTYGIGQQNASTNDTTIFVKSSLTGSWSVATNGTVTNTTLVLFDPLFVTDGTYIYFTTGGGTNIGRYTIASNTMNATWSDAGVTLFGGIMGADGNMYGYGQTGSPLQYSLYKLVATTSVAVGPLIPITQTIVNLVPYQTYLAIICTSNFEQSRMFVWDYVDTVYFVDRVNIGYGVCSGGEIQDGVIFATIANQNNRGFKIKAYSGGQFTTLYTYVGRYLRSGIYNYGFPVSRPKSLSGFIYFIVAICRPDSTNANFYEYAIARYGRKDSSQPYNFCIYKTLDYTSGPSGVSTVGNDLIILEDIVSGTTFPERAIYAVIYNTTNSSSFFESTPTTYSSQAGVLETFTYNGGDTSTTKQLKAVTVNYLAMPAGGQMTLKYKKDGETTWTTLCVDTSNTNSMSKNAVTVESLGTNLPQFNEIQFRIELLGGVELRGMRFKFDMLSDIYG